MASHEYLVRSWLSDPTAQHNLQRLREEGFLGNEIPGICKTCGEKRAKGKTVCGTCHYGRKESEKSFEAFCLDNRNHPLARGGMELINELYANPCPRCEEGYIPLNDYICEECRYG